jgi:glycogen operon protein
VTGLISKLATLCFGNEAGAAVWNPQLSKSAPSALGATPTPEGVYFSCYSRTAHAVDVCLYDPVDPARESQRVRMQRDHNDVWHAFVPDAKAGALYGFRAHGPWEPATGQWFNPAKLLLDPHAKAIHGSTKWKAHMQPARKDGTPDFRDNGATMMKSVVISDGFDWQGDTQLNTPWSDLVIYEMHVRGFSMLNTALPKDLRGTYAGLGHAASVEYLKGLGITAVQLLPVHQHVDDGFLLAKDLTNFWGYNTIGFFAAHSEYASVSEPQKQVDEFKTMVRELHRAGIEVILDVVYNHTAEGDEQGPALCMRGLDNHSYYMLNGDCRVVNYTGTGNTVNAASPGALRMIMDSLRYWVQEMHVDGFRFDLAATMGRRGELFDTLAPFFLAIAQDPVLSRVKMIAEPWDIGPNGYQVGGFPKPWHELNGRFRDTVRRFWKGDEGTIASFSKRLSGSQDIFGPAGRSPLVTLNFITSHDGFTLRDLWSYNQKHNKANGEDNRDGDNHNENWNCGAEGNTKDPIILNLRRRIARSCLASSFCALGVPFLTMGDERWRTQKGNNNAYCQDNEISWMKWTTAGEEGHMLEFTQKLIRFRMSRPHFRRQMHYNGRINPVTGRPDVAWFTSEGKPLDHDLWHAPGIRFFGMLVEAPDAPHREEPGDGSAPLLLLWNNGSSDISFPLPPGRWSVVFDTSREDSFEAIDPVTKVMTSAMRSVACLMLLE